MHPPYVFLSSLNFCCSDIEQNQVIFFFKDASFQNSKLNRKTILLKVYKWSISSIWSELQYISSMFLLLGASAVLYTD